MNRRPADFGGQPGEEEDESDERGSGAGVVVVVVMVAMVCPSAGGYKICFESPPILLWPIAACQLFLGRGDDCVRGESEFLL